MNFEWDEAAMAFTEKNDDTIRIISLGKLIGMNGKNASNISRTNWERLAAMTDDEIDTSDIPELDDEFFANAKLRMPEGKTPVLLNVDSDVLAWFKKHGSEFHSLVSAALRDYAESHR